MGRLVRRTAGTAVYAADVTGVLDGDGVACRPTPALWGCWSKVTCGGGAARPLSACPVPCPVPYKQHYTMCYVIEKFGVFHSSQRLVEMDVEIVEEDPTTGKDYSKIGGGDVVIFPAFGATVQVGRYCA